MVSGIGGRRPRGWARRGGGRGGGVEGAGGHEGAQGGHLVEVPPPRCWEQPGVSVPQEVGGGTAPTHPPVMLEPSCSSLLGQRSVSHIKRLKGGLCVFKILI